MSCELDKDKTVNNSENEENLKLKWTQEQNIIKSKIVLSDTRDWSSLDDILVGGLDISFIVGDDVNACACYVVMDQHFNTCYQKVRMVKMDSPYIPGFLAFREFGFLAQLVEEQKKTEPNLTPTILMIDGNGILHPNRAGIASHIGVELEIPTIGVAKNLHMLPELGDVDKKKLTENLPEKGSVFNLTTVTDGTILGCALRTSESGVNPVFVSIGTGISLETAVKIVLAFSQYRIPEPTRQADIISREYLRVHHPTQRQIQPVKKVKLKTKTKNSNETSVDIQQ
eukprot:TRINITY_DN3921_c0_g2_i1.p1 TRINITY_DN3921_c0_g2~~TRINITY_DN3921_c0_g2_i1.p1  ORF type:complete len:284 (+),score=46.16 TRINITY_DN3921_c0_g2_i1:586-1437(+)